MSKEKFVPYEKLSKKERRAIDQARRQGWGEVNPVTRCPENSRAYNRKAENRRWKADHHDGSERQGGFLMLSSLCKKEAEIHITTSCHP